ncbi:MAG: hypothetical protein QJR05_11490, partial [Thermoanaerobacterium sp.]|nr:hypothetical protein [Thermoanaerobacterium sp.]
MTEKEFKKEVAIIAEEDKCDIIEIFKKNKIRYHFFNPGELVPGCLNRYYSIAILGGISDEPLIFNPKQRVIIEEEIRNGKKVFAEFCGSIGNVYKDSIRLTKFERLAYVSRKIDINSIEFGDIFDDQCNTRIIPVNHLTNKESVILKYVTAHVHDKLAIISKEDDKIENQALWFENPDNLLIASFRLCNFIKARFSPKDKFKNIIKFIISWLSEQEVNIDIEEEYYVKNYIEHESLLSQIEICIKNAINWFNNADILLSEGKNGAIEGLSSEVYPDGKQKINNTIRTDCLGEIAFAFYLYYLMNGNTKYLKIYKNLSDYIFEYMQSKEDIYYGMIRWTWEAWGTCYQDDTSRAIIPQLLISFYTGENKYLNNCIDALDFLINTTGTDGLRVFRTDNVNLDNEKIQALRNNPGEFPSVHYNA